MELTVLVTQKVKVKIDEARMVDVLKGYSELIEPNGDEYEVAEHVAWSVAVNGERSFIEGIGSIGFNGDKPECPVQVEWSRKEIEMTTEEVV